MVLCQFVVVFEARQSCQVCKDIVHKHPSDLRAPVMMERVGHVKVSFETPLSNPPNAMQRHSHADMLVELQVIPFKVTEWDQRNKVLSNRKSSMSNPSGPFKIFPSMNECPCTNSWRRKSPDVNGAQMGKTGPGSGIKTEQGRKRTAQ
mmetsp:Transcript_17330/g.37393  ORF Transcript_17330/g.37393 Transcript_17330/m.37393 type:complete len:148 (+) Transcript_17330:189-632(+)